MLTRPDAVPVEVASATLTPMLTRPMLGASAIARARRSRGASVLGSTLWVAITVTSPPALIEPPREASVCGAIVAFATLAPVADSSPTLSANSSALALWLVSAATFTWPVTSMREPSPIDARTSGVILAMAKLKALPTAPPASANTC